MKGARISALLLAMTAVPGLTQAADLPSESAVTRRVAWEERLGENPFAIVPHRPNYMLPLTYTNSSTSRDSGVSLSPLEAKFQFSLKVPLAKDLVGGHTRLYFGYTQFSLWQAYNRANSASFRETNYEPEIMMAFLHERDVLGWRSRLFTVGINHQSNGLDLPFSRSWNRLYAHFVLERNDVYVSFRPWLRIPEEAKSSPADTIGDDNPDIESFMGNFELRTLYTKGHETYGLMLRNNLREENRGAVEIDYTYPLGKQVRGYVQYFSGYGESLIDYNRYTTRFGFGMMLVNWL